MSSSDREEMQEETAHLYREQARLLKGIGLVSVEAAQALEHLAGAYMQLEPAMDE